MYLVLYIDEQKPKRWEWVDQKTAESLIHSADRPLSHLAIKILKIDKHNFLYPLPAKRYKPYTFSKAQKAKDEMARMNADKATEGIENKKA